MADVERRLYVRPFGNCHVNLVASILRLCHSQSCGKCVPCRIGLSQLSNILDDILVGRASMGSLDLLERTAVSIYESADCAIGYETANTVLRGLRSFRDDYVNHVHSGKCSPDEGGSVPCVERCPAHVDIPGYIALVEEGRYADAVRLIRKDNPFPAVCGLICEHPCEKRCRRNILDIGVNIRGLKRFAVDSCGQVPAPVCAPGTGKRVAIIGGGPAGLSAAYFLALMGHEVSIFEKRRFLGGMLRYGIPSYRLPRETLQWDIDAILSTGSVSVELRTDVGVDISLADLRASGFDSCFVAIGAHTEKKLGLDGEDMRGVISAVHMLRGMGVGRTPDFSGKRVIVVGGGNVAMDVARSSVRLGAKNVTIAYRRRREDMTALQEEVEGAVAEGCELLTLQAPLRIEGDGQDGISALWVQPQIIGPVERGRPRPMEADKPALRLPCDLLILAIGQNIESEHFIQSGIKADRNVLQVLPNGSVEVISDGSAEAMEGVFAGGDCATGPATVIKAIEAGKVAAANIDRYLGFDHKIAPDVKVPEARPANKRSWGRVNMRERGSSVRRGDFDLMELGMSAQEAKQEAGRCLRCDKFGYGAFKGGRVSQW
ncbi:MAG: FAD-dependent oxidoreductase [Clostridiales Family XIII bacterium]|nr:FAD-dependent oxidoreductase [Clostridiales Family XIII bacterium]